MKDIIKDLIGFGKVRLFVTIFGVSITFLFIDMSGAGILISETICW